MHRNRKNSISVYMWSRNFVLKIMLGLSILTYNFDGFHPFAERRGDWMADYIELHKPEICCFQQVSPAIHAILQSRFGKAYHFYHADEGLLTMSQSEGEKSESVDDKCCLSLVWNETLCIHNVYLPMGDDKESERSAIMDSLLRTKDESAAHHHIYAGFFAIGRDDEHLIPEKLENTLFGREDCLDVWHLIGSPHLCRYTFDPMESTYWGDKITTACRPSRIITSWKCKIDKFAICVPEMSFHRGLFVKLQN